MKENDLQDVQRMAREWLALALAALFPLIGSSVAADVAADVAAKEAEGIECEGSYPYHVQGVCADGKGALFWSFTTVLVKTAGNGSVIKKIAVENHHGDLCFHDGRIYVAVNLGQFNRPAGQADSWVYVYRADDLALVSRHEVPEVVHGAGGMEYHDGKFIVVGGLPEGTDENYAYLYAADFSFLRREVIDSGYTKMGVQTLALAGGDLWFGCYGGRTLKTGVDFSLQENFPFDCALGIVVIGEGRIYVARRVMKGKQQTARLVEARVAQDGLLRLLSEG